MKTKDFMVTFQGGSRLLKSTNEKLVLNQLNKHEHMLWVHRIPSTTYRPQYSNRQENPYWREVQNQNYKPHKEMI